MNISNGGHDHSSHHAYMVADFRKRFWISIILTAPILILSPMIQKFIGLGESIRFTGDFHALFAFSSVVFVYGGFPFLKGIVAELRSKQPGMMTLIALAIITAYVYSSTMELDIHRSF